MDLLQAIVLGIVQGLTEFLPISSSGHLRIVPAMAGWQDPGAAFTAVIQLGTMAAVVLYFWGDLTRIVRAWLASLRDASRRSELEVRLGWYLIWGTVPIVIFGFTFAHQIETGARSLYLIGTMLIALGLLLLAAEKVSSHDRDVRSITLRDAIVIGFAQALALIPGVSRSGATITAGLALGMTREAAARFSFLLATPITLGAGLYGSRDLLTEAHSGVEWLAIGAGFGAAAISGLLAIGFLLAWLRRRSVAAFSLYRLAFAAVVVALVLAGR